MNLKLGIYFGDTYNSEHAEAILGAISHWLVEEPANAQFSSDVGVSEVGFARLSKRELFRGQQVSARLAETPLRNLVRTKYLERLTSTLRRSHRQVSLVPWVADDDTATFELKFALNDGEEVWPLEKLVSETCGERELVSALAGLDPLWASLGVISVTPVLAGIRNGDETLPDCGYYGSRLVARIGENTLRQLLVSCPKAEWQPSGGVFLCWGWLRPTSSQGGYPAFRKGIDAVARGVV